MYKKQLLLILSLFISSFLFAQANENAINDGKYTVKIISNTDSSYGYEILESDKSILRQQTRPFFTTTRGFIKKMDALKMGQLVLNTYKQNGRFPEKTTIEEAKKAGISVY